jgi:general stress protein YciG
MADREQSHTAKPGMDEKPQRNNAGKGGQTGEARADLVKNRDRGVKPGGTVGRDVPDQSFEHNTEIAVEAGRKGEHRDDDK